MRYTQIYTLSVPAILLYFVSTFKHPSPPTPPQPPPGRYSTEPGGGGLTFVYPYGATMTVQSPAHPVLSSGPISYPLNRPIAGVWEKPSEAPLGSKEGGRGGRGGRRAGGGAGGRGNEGQWAVRAEGDFGAFEHKQVLAPALRSNNSA